MSTSMSLSTHDDQALERIAQLLRTARRLLFITGAGVSADSGLPTYRGPTGLYNAGQTTSSGVSIEHALSGSMFVRRPEVTWQAILELERPTRGALPNRAHHVIAEMDHHFDDVWTLTQNVDGFHRRAGSRQVLDVHGDLRELRCSRCPYRATVQDYAGLAELPPRCPHCGGIIRPAVVLFGEELPEEKMGRLWDEIQAGFDLVFSIGTSSLFPYVAAPVLMARNGGIPTVEINPEETAVTKIVEFKIAAGAAKALDRLWELYLKMNPAS
jgi:NAD-dependent deacetylase